MALHVIISILHEVLHTLHHFSLRHDFKFLHWPEKGWFARVQINLSVWDLFLTILEVLPIAITFTA